MSDFDATADYREFKITVTTLITEHNQSTMVPACPEWTLRDVLGHLVGQFEDIRDGNVAELGQPRWTAAQVARHQSADLATILRTWDDVLDDAGDRAASVASAALPDIAIHEFDVRGAVDDMGNRESPALVAAIAFFVPILSRRFTTERIPALRLLAADNAWVIGDGSPTGSVRSSPFEASRMLTGRRSVGQIRALEWDGDPSPWIGHMSLFPIRATDLVE